MTHSALTSIVFGRLSWDAIPYHEPILVFTFIVIIKVIDAVVIRFKGTAATTPATFVEAAAAAGSLVLAVAVFNFGLRRYQSGNLVDLRG